MTAIENSIMTWVNQFAQQSWTIDRIMVFIHDSQLLKGGVLMAVLWLLWFRKNRKDEDRPLILTVLFVSAVGLFVARFFAMILPFRNRPMHNPDLEFTLPETLEPAMLDGWSSLPSDHAVLFFTLAIGIFLVSRWIGILAVIYTLAAICAPRVYLGLHYPSDILAGLAVSLCMLLPLKGNIGHAFIGRPLMKLHDGIPGIFYAGFFLLSYQIADMFDSSRSLAAFVWKMYKALEK